MRHRCRKLAAFLFLPTGVETSFAVPVYFDSTNNFHRDLQYHPEQPERIAACLRELEKHHQRNPGTIDLIDVAEVPSGLFSDIQHKHDGFSVAELSHAEAMLLKVHSKDTVLQLKQRCHRSKQKRLDEGKPALGHIGYLDSDTYVTTETYDVCLRATAAWIRAADFVWKNGGGAMALTRPPGHHATQSESNGFCLFNFAAASVAHILERNPSAKVSVLDWDVHYGQGVANILMDEPRARYVSIHQHGAFPFMGQVLKTHGEHNNVLTIPISPDTTWSSGYKDRFKTALDFICKQDEWIPDIVIICGGYDALRSDELASMDLNSEDYGTMTEMLIRHLEASVGLEAPKIMVGLEGGYQLSPTAAGGNLQDAVIETVKAIYSIK
jgi:acetoin utilization deacetylase AcuC-like enzyme